MYQWYKYSEVRLMVLISLADILLAFNTFLLLLRVWHWPIGVAENANTALDVSENLFKASEMFPIKSGLKKQAGS